jgi:hypothetical protein
MTGVLTRVVDGPVAAYGLPTTDNRRLEFGSLSVRNRIQRLVELDRKPAEVQLPLMALQAPGADHAGAKVVGQITRVWVSDNWIRIEGTADSSVPPGRYACGIDLSQVTMRLSWVDAPNDLVTEEELVKDRHRPVLQTATRARLVAVTLYLEGSTASPAFPSAGVRVQ